MWLKEHCPIVFEMLNEKTKRKLPIGVLNFLDSGSNLEMEFGRYFFMLIEKYLILLISKTNKKYICDKYRRELSNVNSEEQLSQLFSEIAVCATISKASNRISLKPNTRGKKNCDFHAIIENFEVYGEVKRYVDKSTIEARSIFAHNDFEKKTKRPRYLELVSKLNDTYEQLPKDSINLILLFHSSTGETVRYLKQALFGESNFMKINDELILEPYSLFSKAEWENISAVCLCKLGENELVKFYEIFMNPKARNHLPDIVLEKIRNMYRS